MLLVTKYSRTVILTVITLTALWFLIKYSKIPICLTDFDIVPLNRHVETIQTLDRNMSLIFLGGVPRSGMKLMGTLLDAHSEVRSVSSLAFGYCVRHSANNFTCLCSYEFTDAGRRLVYFQNY